GGGGGEDLGEGAGEVGRAADGAGRVWNGGSMNQTNFDSVALKQPDGTLQRMTAQEFSAIRITERVRMVCAGSVIFYRNGQSIPATEAFRRPDMEVFTTSS